ncbi:hypothetical protein, partial [Sansalvadorimonas verongulae]|uniref:hypothetical protein n=1 Tax=Sansalvadorimonas verongulae TaxID=2172824 RepID=UPI001E4626AC
SNGLRKPLSESLASTLREMYVDIHQTLINWDDRDSYRHEFKCHAWEALAETDRQKSLCHVQYGPEASFIAEMYASFFKGYLGEIKQNGYSERNIIREIKAALKESVTAEDDYVFSLIRERFEELLPPGFVSLS